MIYESVIKIRNTPYKFTAHMCKTKISKKEGTCKVVEDGTNIDVTFYILSTKRYNVSEKADLIQTSINGYIGKGVYLTKKEIIAEMLEAHRFYEVELFRLQKRRFNRQIFPD